MHLTQNSKEKKHPTTIIATVLLVLITLVAGCTSNSHQFSKTRPVCEETNPTAFTERQSFKASDALTALATALEKKPGFKNAEFRSIEIKRSVDNDGWFITFAVEPGNSANEYNIGIKDSGAVTVYHPF